MSTRSPGRLGLVAALGFAVAQSACGAEPTRHDVDIRAFEFDPPIVEVTSGDTVRWTNHDLVPHTVTDAEGAWSSGSIAPGASWLLVATDTMSTAYLCTFHPTMTGSVAIR